MGGWVYMMKCADSSYYVGSTSKHVDDRVIEHNLELLPGYTSTRRPVTLVYSFEVFEIRDAHEAERRIKGWSRAKKEALIRGDVEALRQLAKRPGARRQVRGSRAPAAALRSPPHHDEAQNEEPV